MCTSVRACLNAGACGRARVPTPARHVADGDSSDARHEAEDGEDDEAGVETGGAVDERDDQRVSVRSEQRRLAGNSLTN